MYVVSELNDDERNKYQRLHVYQIRFHLHLRFLSCASHQTMFRICVLVVLCAHVVDDREKKKEFKCHVNKEEVCAVG